jgi:polysaccharide deacetylase 2 family uncharacterized protein YibQ
MPKVPRFKFTLSSALLWRVGFITLAVICVLLLGALWLSGGRETNEAVNSGRRLLIALADGTIEGRMGGVEPPPVAPPASTEAPPADIPDYPGSVPDYPESSPSAETTPNAATPSAEAAVALPEEPEQPPEPAPPEAAPGKDDLAAIPPSANPTHDVNIALIEKTKSGDVPTIGKDGTKPWRYYAKPFDRKGKQPMIVIIVSGLGQNKTVTDNALKLPENVTLSFSPYSKQITSWGTAARVIGHEVLMDLPLQPINFPAADPGPYGLLLTNPPEDNEKRFEWLLSRLPVYVGFLTPQSEMFSTSPEAFKLLLQDFANHGLMLAIGREPAKDDTKAIIDSTITASVVADALIDEDLSASGIQTKLTTLEQLAKKRGYAVGIAQGLPITIDQLKQWSDTLEQKGIVLVPVSTVVKLRFS